MGLKFFDLFAGIGGFRLGMERAGHECVGSCEWDKYARETYKKNFGSYPEYNDAKNMSLTTQPYFDVLCAGFPCQAFSIAGKRLGFEDTRGTIFFEIARVAKEKRPPYLFLENVRGLLSHDKGRTFRTILNTLDEMGYDAEWQVLNSKYFVPQNRERIFIIGHLRGERTGKIFPVGENVELSADRKKESGEIVNCLTGGGHSEGLHSQMTLIAWSKSTRDWGVESRIKENEANTLNTGEGCRTQSSANYVIIEKSKIRRLTPLECERLQGFPDNWTQGVSDTQRYKQCGNAVTVNVVEYIAKELRIG